MVFVVLRHSQSSWNKENKFTGWTDIGLSEQGKIEAIEAGKILRNYSFDAVFTSELSRTKETFNLMKTSIKYDKDNIYSNIELNERDYGDLTGLNKDEIKKEYGEQKLHSWRRSYYDRPPNGENLEDVKNRVELFYKNNIQSLLDENKNILIVSHGNTLRALFVLLGFYNEENIETFEIPTGKPIKIDIINKQYQYINVYELEGKEILDSRGYPTIQINLIDKRNNKIIGKGECPSGSSCGISEALELRDGDKKRFIGKGVLKALENIQLLNEKLILTDDTITDVINIDKQMKAIDNTENKNILGGNVFTAISFCFLNVASNKLGIEMYEYINTLYEKNIKEYKLPTIMANIINGGKHGEGGLKIQEFMIVPDHKHTIKKRVQMICEVYYQLKKCLLKDYGSTSTNIGDEGGFVVCGMKTTDEALNTIEESIKKCNYEVGTDIYIALDCASSEFYNEETKLYEVEKEVYLTTNEMVDYYGKMIEKHPCVKSIEDPFHETDYEGWIKMTERYGNKINIVGDDLYCTNPKLIQNGIENKWSNSLLLKVNQIGTITEAIEGANKIFGINGDVIVSHRSGENNQSYLIDLAVGIGAKYVKIGAPCRGERISKYNRLMEIEDILNNDK